MKICQAHDIVLENTIYKSIIFHLWIATLDSNDSFFENVTFF